jgi:hypothetical protein
VALKRSSEGLLSPAKSKNNKGGSGGSNNGGGGGGGGAFSFGMASPRANNKLGSPRRRTASSYMSSPRSDYEGQQLASPRRTRSVGDDAFGATPGSPRNTSSSSSRQQHQQSADLFAVRRASLVGDDTDEEDRYAAAQEAEQRQQQQQRPVPKLHFPSPGGGNLARSPVAASSRRSASAGASADAVLAAEQEALARKRTDALEEEIRLLRLAEQAELDAEAVARVAAAGRAGGAAGGAVQRSPRPSTARSHVSNSSISSSVAAPPLSPHSSAAAAAYVNGSVSARGYGHLAHNNNPAVSGSSGAPTSNREYGVSRPGSARPAAGEKPNPFPAFMRASEQQQQAPQQSPQQQQQQYVPRPSAIDVRPPSRPSTAMPRYSEPQREQQQQHHHQHPPQHHQHQPQQQQQQQQRHPLTTPTSPRSYEPLSPGRPVHPVHALPPSSLAPSAPPSVHALPPTSARAGPSHHHHYPSSGGGGSSSSVQLTPRSTHGLAAPRSTQHNLLCAAMAMVEEFDREHLVWLQEEIRQRIARKDAEEER